MCSLSSDASLNAVVSFKTTLSLAEQLWVREYRTIILTSVYPVHIVFASHAYINLAGYKNESETASCQLMSPISYQHECKIWWRQAHLPE